MAAVTRVLAATKSDDVEAAISLLRRGHLVALPSETVYGLAGRGLDDDVVRAIFGAKGRPSDNPVILHVASLADALPLWALDEKTDARVRALAARFWPGPLTIVAPKSALVSNVVSAELLKVAVRVPAHPVFAQVLRALGEPLAAPSANASGRPSPTRAEDVRVSLEGRIDAILDGGACAFGIESTVVDVSGEAPVLLRPGAITLAQLQATLADVRARGPHDDEGAASPGLRHRHYAPAIALMKMVRDVEPHWQGHAALLVRRETARRLGARAAPLEILDDDASGFARGLYAALYRLERAAPPSLIVEAAPDDELWTAVRDRLARAVAD